MAYKNSSPNLPLYRAFSLKCPSFCLFKRIKWDFSRFGCITIMFKGDGLKLISTSFFSSSCIFIDKLPIKFKYPGAMGSVIDYAHVVDFAGLISIDIEMRRNFPYYL
jgi:hypothetical protein